MIEPNLLIICITAFVAVVLMLSILAGVIRGLMAVFPERAVLPERTDRTGPIEGADAALLAAIHSAAALSYPGMKATRIEETR